MEIKTEISSLAGSIKKGNTEMLLSWIDLNKIEFYRMSWAFLKNHADVEDAFHNTIIKVMENINKLKKEDAFKAWFISILLNECRKILRAKKRFVPSEDFELCGSTCAVEENILELELSEGLKKINKEFKEVIVLKYYGGYSQKEIAEILNIPLGTVKTRLFRGLKILKELMGKEE